MDKPHINDVEAQDNAQKRSRARKVAAGLGSAAVVGVGSFIALKNGISYGEVSSAVEAVLNGQIVPKPTVYPEAVDAMVAVNEGIRNAAIPTMLTATGALAVVKYHDTFSAEYEMSKHDYSGTDSFTEHESNGIRGKAHRAFAGVGLAATTVLLTGGSSGIEHEISNGPERPITQTFDLLSGGSTGPRGIIVQSKENSFMDDAAVRKAQLNAFAKRAAKSGVRVVPFHKSLQNIDDRPGLIVTVPDQVFTGATGKKIDNSCETIPIMLDEANTKRVGEQADINGVKVQVIEKLSGAAQMNRDVAVIAESDANCIEKQDSKTTFGAVVSGGKEGEAQTLFDQDPLSKEATMITEQEFDENNRDFWRKNGTPLVLQLMGYIGALSYIGISNERRGAMQRNVQAIAALHSQGVSFKTIKRIESIRALRDSLKATVIAAPLMPLVAGAFNAAEVGLRVGVGLKEVAVGGSIALAAKLFGGRRAVKRFEKKLNVESALKG